MQALIALGVTLVFVGAFVCCSFPKYFTAEVATDGGGEVSEVAPPDGTEFDSGPTVVCNDGGLRAGESIACSCDDDAGAPPPDVGPDGEAGAFGYRTCTLDAAVGSCVGCAPVTKCEGLTVPLGTTCIPGGVVTLGVANDKVCPPAGCAVEKPEHTVALTRFVIDDREVTVKRFRDWWGKGHVAPSEGQVLFNGGDGTAVRWLKGFTVTEPTKADATNQATWLGEADPGNDAAPINDVDWPTALAFCVADGARLPTEAEWEATASGRSNRLFPGEPPDTKKLAPTVDQLPCVRAISAVASGCTLKMKTTEGFSKDGAYDLAGSLAEWVLDVAPAGAASCTTGCYPAGPAVDPLFYFESVKLRGVRGGHWADTEPKRLRAQARDFIDVAARDPHVGFRCVRR